MHGRSYKLGLMGLAALLLVGGAFQQRQLNRQRTELGLTRSAPLENAPPVLAFTTVALGGFRGLIANALWIRANDLQMEDRFFEQVQLSDWITKLQPTFAQVWIVQAWNMAYNISVKFRDPGDRWRWVMSGIELLRDQGLRYNPKEPLIYRELGWFFQHKIGQAMDDAHLYYKAAWATNMTGVLGAGRPNYEELLNPRTEEARLRVQRLREVYKMEPAMMQKVEALYGPLEWRLPEASAIYWAVTGLEKANRHDPLALRRVIYQCLHTCVLRGRIIRVREDGNLSFGPDLSKISLAHEGYEKLLAEETEKPDAVRKAHRNFLKEVIYLLYTRNRLAESEQWLKVLKEKYPDSVPPNQTAEQFALGRLDESLGDANYNRTRTLLENLLLQHFENLAVDDDDHAAGVLLLARKVSDNYVRKTGGREAVKLEALPEMFTRVRDEMLGAKSNLPEIYKARLRAKLNLPEPPKAIPAPPPAPAGK